MSTSPSPSAPSGFQNTPVTPVPPLSFAHHTSEYTCSYSFSSITTGRMALSASASGASPSSRGSTYGSGTLSIASACLFAMQFRSHALAGSGSPGLRRIVDQCRSRYHCSFSNSRASSGAFAARYASRVSSALRIVSSVTGSVVRLPSIRLLLYTR